MTASERLMAAAFACLVALFLAYVWPTPYQVYRMNETYLVRVNRFTGEGQALTPCGWRGYSDGGCP